MTRSVTIDHRQRRLPSRARRKLSYLRFLASDRRTAARSDARAIRTEGGWRWFHELPHLPVDELRARHVAVVTRALDVAEIPYFVVPSTAGERVQVGVLSEHAQPALRAVEKGLRGRAWYTIQSGMERLVDEARLDHRGVTLLYPRYFARGTRFLSSAELAVSLMAWEEGESGCVPPSRSRNLPSLLREEGSEATVAAYGRSWRSVAALITPHADQVSPLRWFVRVPASLRSRAPHLADALGLVAARSAWFHCEHGTEVLLLDEEADRWCLEERQVTPQRPTEDEVTVLSDVWLGMEEAIVVLPAGGMLTRSLATNRLVTSGGLSTFAADPVQIGWKPEHVITESHREILEQQRWFADRFGKVMPWSVSAVPVALPAVPNHLRSDLRAFAAAPDRPRVMTVEAAVTVLLWWAYEHRLAVTGYLRAVRYRAGTRKFRDGCRAVVAGRMRPEVVALDSLSLVSHPGELSRWEELVRNRLPVPAPWELQGRGPSGTE